jgi:hypothetical protein
MSLEDFFIFGGFVENYDECGRSVRPEKLTIQAKLIPLEGIAATKADKALYNIVEVNHGR